MIRIKRYVLLPFVFILIFFILQGCSAEDKPASLQIKVMATVPEGVIIESANPVWIDSGGTAEFTLKISGGFKLTGIDTAESAVSALASNSDDNSCGAVYENGVLRLENILYPTTLRMNVRPFENYKYFIKNDAENGSVKSNVETGNVVEDTYVTVSAEASEDYIFIGWSSGALLAEHGTLLSYSTEYSFNINSDTTLFPNYLSKNNKYIKYNSNGGIISGSNADSFYYEVKTEHYPCPNAFGGTGLFSREGYALLEYNTEPDGSGTAIGLGGNVTVSEDSIVELFAQWVKYSDASLFSYKESNGEITINGYNGSEEALIIPEEIDGKPVVAIASGALKGKNFKTLFLTKNLAKVSSGAISDCPDFETLYISDGISSITDASVSDCPKFANLRVNAVMDPRYSLNLGWASSIKYKRLITAEGKRLIVIAGSSAAFGLNSPLLSELMENEYSVVNFGTHAGTCSLFFLEFTANQIREGDIVVIAPEPRIQQQGDNQFSSLLWQIIEGYYDCFRYVDIRNYENVLSSLAEFNSARRKMTPLNYENYVSDVNIYGDILTNTANRAASWVQSPDSISFSNYMKAVHANRLNGMADIIYAGSGRLYMSFSPANENALTASSLRDSAKTSYNENIRRLTTFPLISKVEDYIFPGNYFSDTDLHLSSAGARERTKRLASDIKAQLDTDAQKAE